MHKSCIKSAKTTLFMEGLFRKHETQPSGNGFENERKGDMAGRKKSTEEKVKDGLLKLAFGDVSDAVRLLYLSDEEALARLPKLNLYNVSEIKRPKGGGMEIKFFDRIKACEKLREISGEKTEGSLSFYEALEKSAAEDDGNG